MTRLALLADIHGNLPALEAVMTDMSQFAPDHVVVAGDMINWGPFSAEVMQIIYENRWTMIRGNNAYYVINAQAPRRPDRWAHFTMLDWLYDQLTDWHYTLMGLPDEVLLCYPDAPDVYMCHGIPHNPWQGIYSAEHNSDEVLEWLSPARAKTIFCGHTHIPLDRRVGEYHIINSGSVGVPLLGQPVSSYMIVDGDSAGWQVAHHRQLAIDTDAQLERLLPAWEAQHFVERGGVASRMVIEEFKQSRVVLHAFNQWMAEHHSDEIATHAHGYAFLALDDWSAYMPPEYRVVS